MKKDLKNKEKKRSKKEDILYDIEKYRSEFDIVYILDKSGSMSGTETTTINGFNDYINEEKRKLRITFDKYQSSFMREYEKARKKGYLIDPYNLCVPNVSLVLFDDYMHYVYRDKSLLEISNLEYNDYRPSGSTALLDTIGAVINDLDDKNSNKAIIMITTDGYENSSYKYSRSDIDKLIKSHDNYTVVYIGAEIDSFKEARSIGIEDDYIVNYSKEVECEKIKSNCLNSLTEDVCKCKKNNKWKEDLEIYMEKNKD